tara:strand:- start:531 stop:737 length:207 start_codon:yes stop_codon:yes gene_type:complete
MERGNMSTVQVTVRQNYGQDMVYPVNTIGEAFCSLTGNKTLRPCDLSIIRDLGFEVEVVADIPEGLGL